MWEQQISVCSYKRLTASFEGAPKDTQGIIHLSTTTGHHQHHENIASIHPSIQKHKTRNTFWLLGVLWHMAHGTIL